MYICTPLSYDSIHCISSYYGVDDGYDYGGCVSSCYGVADGYDFLQMRFPTCGPFSSSTFSKGVSACKHVPFPKHVLFFVFITCSNPATNSTVAVTPLVLTPLVRNQGESLGIEGSGMPQSGQGVQPAHASRKHGRIQQLLGPALQNRPYTIARFRSPKSRNPETHGFSRPRDAFPKAQQSEHLTHLSMVALCIIISMISIVIISFCIIIISSSMNSSINSISFSIIIISFSIVIVIFIVHDEIPETETGCTPFSLLLPTPAAHSLRSRPLRCSNNRQR